MNSPLLQTIRSRWFIIGAHLGLWCVFYLALTHLGGKTPDFHVADSTVPPLPGPVPVSKMESIFGPAQSLNLPAVTNISNPFFTTYFVPIPSPTPPTPTTRKVEVTYQGYYEASDLMKHAVVKIADAFVVASLGTQIATNLFVAEADLQNLMLTNLTAQTNILILNTKKEIEIPIK